MWKYIPSRASESTRSISSDGTQEDHTASRYASNDRNSAVLTPEAAHSEAVGDKVNPEEEARSTTRSGRRFGLVVPAMPAMFAR